MDRAKSEKLADGMITVWEEWLNSLLSSCSCSSHCSRRERIPFSGLRVSHRGISLICWVAGSRFLLTPELNDFFFMWGWSLPQLDCKLLWGS